MRRLATIIGICAAAAVLSPTSASLPPAGAASRDAANPEIKHVFIVMLENENADVTFGANTHAPYLAQTLRSQGAFLPNYYATGHLSLDNYISMVSGQAPSLLTQADCPIYLDFLAAPLPVTPDGQVTGTGCVYPAGTVQTVANLLEDHGYTWKGYMEDMAAKAPAEPASCRHPGLGSVDNTQSAEVGDQYAGRHNPFVYFHSIIDFPTCAKNDVDYSRLAGDLQSASTTANYSFITPNLCHDGHDSPCVSGEPGGLTTADQWLQSNIPQILNSPGYKDHGLLIVTFDEAGSGDSSACCNEQSGPNTISPGGSTPGPGGGKVGAVLLSPCISPGTSDETPYNHYSMLKSVENFFGLPYLGYSRQAGLASFGSKIFTRSDCGATVSTKKCKKAKKHKTGHGKKKAQKTKKSKKKRKACRKKKRKKHHTPHRQQVVLPSG
ncbi:MAG: phosphatidylinositol-3-phosphatase [Gaiellaceae bacterium]|nr:phosphatidylinositol-3-phosphatase [Gaiellaceae bacterium]